MKKRHLLTGNLVFILFLGLLFSCKKEDDFIPCIPNNQTITINHPFPGSSTPYSLDVNCDGVDDLMFLSYRSIPSTSGVINYTKVQGLNGVTIHSDSVFELGYIPGPNWPNDTTWQADFKVQPIAHSESDTINSTQPYFLNEAYFILTRTPAMGHPGEVPNWIDLIGETYYIVIKIGTKLHWIKCKTTIVETIIYSRSIYGSENQLTI